MKLLITGASGMLGSNLIHYFRHKHDIIGLYHHFALDIPGIESVRCDLQDVNQIRRIFRVHEPDAVIHCASLTNVDYCEFNQKETDSINVWSSRYICELVGEHKLIFISSDSVYDGIYGFYSEAAGHESPQNYYGLSKLEAEKNVMQCSNALCLRTNIFGWNVQDKQSIGEWALNALQGRQAISGFTDAVFSSIYTMELARLIDIALAKDLKGVFNCASSDACSKYDFILKIADKFGFLSDKVSKISINDFEFKAKRGKNLSLNVAMLEKELDYRIPSIDQSVDQFYRDWKTGLPNTIKTFHAEKKSTFRPVINYGRQWVNHNDLTAVSRVLRSDFLTQGPQIPKFESALSEICSARFAIAVNSGTAALHLACMAAGIGKGDEVVTSPITFVASANCVAYCGGRPVFADIDPMTYNISPESVEKMINSKTKAVIPVHFAGQSSDMAGISKIVKAAEKRYNHRIYIIEDACHALGSICQGFPVGSGIYSDMTAMSFHPVKHITTGEGGAVLTNDSVFNDFLQLGRAHGIKKTYSPKAEADNASECQERFKDPWYYEQVSLGYNYRITDLQCILGCSQLDRLTAFAQRRRWIVDRYNEAFEGLPRFVIPFESGSCNSNFHLYVVKIDFEYLGMPRRVFMARLKEKGILAQVHYIPVHTQPYYRAHYGTGWGDCPIAEKYYSECLSLPLYPAMTDKEVQYVIDILIQMVNA